jgi:hypothetical protein
MCPNVPFHYSAAKLYGPNDYLVVCSLMLASLALVIHLGRSWGYRAQVLNSGKLGSWGVFRKSFLSTSHKGFATGTVGF